MKYLLIDTANTFFRAKHMVYKSSTPWEKVGYALHIVLSSINKVATKFQADHIVFCLEGRSWRKDVYAPYKKNRSDAKAALTAQEQEENALFMEALGDLSTYLESKSNCSVVQEPTAEADDIIARWIHLHPNDEHIIVSSDSDYMQLLSTTVTQYNGITDELSTIYGIYDSKGKEVIDKKTKLPKAKPNPQWLLFEKCMRGDSSDNIFSAYPGVRVKGTKHKTGLTEAFVDRFSKGYAWNNLMLQRWTDHNGVEHRVIDDYNRNMSLIDLTAQPDNIKNAVDAAIIKQVNCQQISQVGSYFLKFCGKYELTKLAEFAVHYSDWLNKPYKGVLKNDIGKTDSQE